MKKRESVVIFKGEDKFIMPRARTYDLKSGKSEFVGITEEEKEIIPVRGNPYGYNQGTFEMPDTSDPSMCDRIKDYINTRGAGTATPESLMSAYNAFNQYCKAQIDVESTTTQTSTSTTTETTTLSTSGIIDTTTLLPQTSIINSPIDTPNLGINLKDKNVKNDSNSGINKNMLFVLIGIGVIGAAYYYYKKVKK